MLRSLSRFMAGAAVIALLPSAAQAQQTTCNRIEGVASAPCAVLANLAIPGLALLEIDNGTGGVRAFDIASVTTAQWEGVLDGTTPVTVPLETPYLLTFRANAAVGIDIAGVLSSVVVGHSRVVGDYQFEVVPVGTCTGAGTELASQTIASGLPTGAGVTARSLCLYAVLDGSNLTKVMVGDYQLEVTLTITAP